MMADFFDRIAKEYRSGAAHMFMLHYNLRDIFNDLEYGYLPTLYYLMEQLNVIGCDIVLGYTPSKGIIWPYVDQWKSVQRSLGLIPDPVEWEGDQKRENRPIGHFRSDGAFIADELGLARVRAKVNMVESDPTTVWIRDDQITRLEISPKNFKMQAGKRFRFSLTAYDKNNRSIAVRTARWWVEGEIGETNRDGVFTAKKAGIGKLKVRVRNLETESGEITVVPGELAKIEIETPDRIRFLPDPGSIVAPKNPHKFKLIGEDLFGNPVEVKKADWEIVPQHDQNRSRRRINSGVIHWKVHEDPFISGRMPPGNDLRGKLDSLLHIGNFKVGLVMFSAEKIFPNVELTTLSHEMQIFLDTFQQWSSDFDMRLKKHIVLIGAENITDVNPIITKNSDIPVIEVPFPNYNDRYNFIQHLTDLPISPEPDQKAQISTRITLDRNYSKDQAARDTTGLNLFGIHDVALRAEEARQPITAELIENYRNESVEIHSRGIFEVLSCPHDLAFVGGMRHVEPIVRDFISAIHEGDLKRIPRGLLLIGPPGTGKTMVAQLMARYGNLAFVRLKNPREWMGVEGALSGDLRSYERNLTMALNFIKAITPLVVFIDDIDFATNPIDLATSQRPDSMLPVELLNMMRDEKYHGKILWFGATNRPDLIDSAFRKRGIFDEKLILLRPTDGERPDIIEKLFKKHQITIQNIDFNKVDKLTRRRTGGDLERIVLRSYVIAKRNDRDVVTQADLDLAVADFVPDYSDEINEFLSLLSIREANARSMLPPNIPYECRPFVDENRIDKNAINKRISKLRRKLEFPDF